MQQSRIVLAILGLSMGSAINLSAADGQSWMNWRGPHGFGATEFKDAPVKFDANNYSWRLDLPGKGCSTPIVVEKNILLTVPIEASMA